MRIRIKNRINWIIQQSMENYLTFIRFIYHILFQYFMNKNIKKILKDHIKMLSEATEIDVYSKKIGLLEHSSMLIDSIIENNDLTDTALHNNVSKS